MNSGAARRDVRGQREVRDPQILDVDVPERVPDRLVKVPTGEHGRDRVGEIQQLTAPICHFLKNKTHRQSNQVTFNCPVKTVFLLLKSPSHLAPGPRLLRDRCYILLGTEQGAHKCPDRHSADHIDGNARLLDRLQHSHVRRSPRATPAQHEAHRVAGQPAGESREVGMYIRLGH